MTAQQEVELVDEIDSDGRVIAVHPRSYLRERAFLHRAVLVLPKAHDGMILLGRRAKSKRTDPDRWCCLVGGMVKSGESDETAAAREMNEEIGMSRPLRKIAEFEKQEFKCIFSLFTTKEPLGEDELVLDPEENQCARAFAVEEALRMAKEEPGEFADTLVVALEELAKSG